MSKSLKVLENGRVSQDQVEDIAGMALQNLKTLMVDYETPIEMRTQIAFRLFEIFSTENRATRREKAVVHCLEENGRNIERNAYRLSYIKTLLGLVTQQNCDVGFQHESFFPGKYKDVITH